MEVLIHLIFKLIKIAIFASIYSLILLLVFRQINQSNPKSWFQRTTINKTKFLFITGLIISILSFGWMFTYWGNPGFGDSARIPIGYGKEIEKNGILSYISPNGYEMRMYLIRSYAVNRNFCTGEDKDGHYFIWNLETNEITKLNSPEKYLIKAAELNLPPIEDFQSFWQGAYTYWGGWRFWLSSKFRRSAI